MCTDFICFVGEVTGRLDATEKTEGCYVKFGKGLDPQGHGLLIMKQSFPNVTGPGTALLFICRHCCADVKGWESEVGE